MVGEFYLIRVRDDVCRGGVEIDLFELIEFDFMNFC